MLLILGLCLFGTLTGVARAHTFHTGDCPDVDPVPDFQMSKFLGIWHVIQKTSSDSKCLIYNFTESEDHDYQVLKVRKNVLLGLTDSDSLFRYTGKIKVLSISEPARMSVNYPLSIGSSKLTVFATDYEDYAAIFTCRKLPFSHRRSASILSRSDTMSKDTLEKLRKKLDSYGVDPGDLDNVDQKDCPSSLKPDLDVRNSKTTESYFFVFK